ncbi:MAG: hypothetical protein K8R41_11030 [Bacteroidales bacterium]|nr:hypothetical protein [Bacteroidales bacterium]
MISRILVIIFSAILFVGCSPKIEKIIEETYPDGSPKLVKLYEINGDSKTMLKEISFYPNRQERYEGAYKEGKRHGDWIYFFENGNKWSKGSFDNGLRNGFGTTWHKNGNKYFEGSYNQGHRTGIWKFWDENGNFVKEINYDEK